MSPDADPPAPGRHESGRHEPALQELFRQEAEQVTDRLDVLLATGTEEAVAEALRLAHTLKGLAVASKDHSLRDLARSLERALASYDAADGTRRAELLSAIDAGRALIAGSPGAPSAARTAAVALEGQPTGAPARPPGVPWARRALLRRLLPLIEPTLAAVAQRLELMERGRDDWRRRADLGRELELQAAAAGLAGQAAIAAPGLELASLLFLRAPGRAAVRAARPVVQQLREALAAPSLDQPLSPRALAGVEPLRAAIGDRGDEERLPLAIELPWPDVDLPQDLLHALDQATAGRAILDARWGQSSARFLRGMLGLAPARRRFRTDGGYVRVPRRRLDRLLGLSEGLVAAMARARTLAKLARKEAEAAPVGARLGLNRLSRSAAELDRELDHLARATREAVLRSRLVACRGLFALARVTVREHLSRHPEKGARVEVEGAGTELDKGILDALVDPLLHLIKNALEHGVEPRRERLRRGKPEAATIRVSAYSLPTGVVLEVEDDGRGLDEARLAEGGEDGGVLLLGDDGERALSFPFGSTREAITDDSGRGVGLARVVERVRSLRGRLVFRNRPGRGTLARIVVPPAVATAKILLVRSGAERYALPLSSVLAVQEAAAVRARGLPTVRLAELIEPQAPPEERRARAGDEAPRHDRRMRERFAVLIAPPLGRSDPGEGDALACVVDDVLRRDLVVVRPLGRRFAPPGVDAAALFGDGRLVLVLDVWRLAVGRRAAVLPGEDGEGGGAESAR